MSEPSRSKDPAALWQAQPEEQRQVQLEQIVNRRAAALHASTRSEILMSIGAAVLLAGVVLLRFDQAHRPLVEAGCALVVVWVAATLYRLRAQIWQMPARPDAAAVTGAAYYRRELERRRDHLRDAWLWHGPLILAFVVLTGIWSGWRFLSFATADRVAPLLVVLVLWTVYGLRRRLRQAKELQREIDELKE